MNTKPNNFKVSSRWDWTPTSGTPSNEQLILGCLQRIADALEAIAAPIISRSNARYDAEMAARRARSSQAWLAFDRAVGGVERFAERHGDAAMRRVLRALDAWVLDKTVDPASFESFVAFVGNGGEFGCGPKTMAQVREALAERSK